MKQEQRPRIKKAVSHREEDVVAKARVKKKRSRIPVIIALFIVAVLLGTWVVWKITTGENIPLLPPPEPPETHAPVKKKEYVENYPVATALPTAPAGKDTYGAHITKEGVLKDTGGRSMSFLRGTTQPVKVKANTQKCETHNVDEFCFAGTVEHSAMPTTHIYAFSDIVHTRMFHTAKNVKKIHVQGANYAGIMYLEQEGKTHPVVVIAHPDSSGFMFMYPENTPTEKIEEATESYIIEDEKKD